MNDTLERVDSTVEDETVENLAAEEVSESALEEVAATVEAMLFSNNAPLSQAKLATIAELPSRSVRRAVDWLNQRYEQSGASFRIVTVAGGYQMQTLPQYHDVLKRMLNVKQAGKLSQPAMETLAIVAYRQPILRADVEAIRGVACGEVLRTLMERQLVKIVGRAEVIGRPMLYGTTRHFLEIFGLAKLEDLPQADELRGMYNAPATAASVDAEEDEEYAAGNGPRGDEAEEPKRKESGNEPEEFEEDEEFDDEFDDDEDEFDDDDDEFDDDDDDEFDDDYDDDYDDDFDERE